MGQEAYKTRSQGERMKLDFIPDYISVYEVSHTFKLSDKNIWMHKIEYALPYAEYGDLSVWKNAESYLIGKIKEYIEIHDLSEYKYIYFFVQKSTLKYLILEIEK